MLDLDRPDLKKILKMNSLECRIVFFFKLINDKSLLCDIKTYKLSRGLSNERKNIKN